MTTFNNGDRHEEEIRQLERELENLERRYANLEGMVKWLKFSFCAFMAALIAMAISGLIIDNAGLIAVSIALLLLSALAAYMGPLSVAPGLALSGRRARWIDVVGQEPPGILGVSIKRSEAMAVEDMIADRRQRLAALHGSPAENHHAVPLRSFQTQQGDGRDGARKNRFIAVIGAIIVVLIGILAAQKALQCHASGGTACCFGRLGCPKPAPQRMHQRESTYDKQHGIGNGWPRTHT